MRFFSVLAMGLTLVLLSGCLETFSVRGELDVEKPEEAQSELPDEMLTKE